MNQQTGPLAAEGTRSNSEVLGEILWLYSHSQLHRWLRLFEVEQFVLPAIKHQRYRIYKRNGVPIGYVGIGRLAKDIASAWLGGKYTLQPDDWVSGDRLWILQYVVPFGDAQDIKEQLRREPELSLGPVWAMRPNKNGTGVRIAQFSRKFPTYDRKFRRQPQTEQGQSGNDTDRPDSELTAAELSAGFQVSWPAAS